MSIARAATELRIVAAITTGAPTSRVEARAARLMSMRRPPFAQEDPVRHQRRDRLAEGADDRAAHHVKRPDRDQHEAEEDRSGDVRRQPSRRSSDEHAPDGDDPDRQFQHPALDESDEADRNARAPRSR